MSARVSRLLSDVRPSGPLSDLRRKAERIFLLTQCRQRRVSLVSKLSWWLECTL